MSTSRHIASRVLLVLYLAGVAVQELGHSHHAPTPLPGGPLVSTHDCGGHERHVPGDKVAPCPACAMGHLRLALPPGTPLTFRSPLTAEKVSDGFTQTFPLGLALSHGERAPPHAGS